MEHTASLNKKRDPYFDSVKFFLITLVVIGHLIEPIIYKSSLFRSLYIFAFLVHIPGFALLAGYLSKGKYLEDKASSLLKRIVVPYLIFQTLYLYVAHTYGFLNKLIYQYTTPYWLLWFMTAYVGWFILNQFFRNTRYGVLFVLFLTLIVGIFPDINMYGGLAKMFYFYPWFYVGSRMSIESWNLLKSFPSRAAFVMLLGLLVLLHTNRNVIDYRQLWGSRSYAYLELDSFDGIIMRLGILCITGLFLFVFLRMIMPLSNRLFGYLGQKSLYVYLLHGFIILYLKHSNVFSMVNLRYEKLGLIVLGIFISLILSLPVVTIPAMILVEPFNFLKKFKYMKNGI